MGSTWLVGLFLAASVGYLGLAGFVWANHRGVASRPLVLMLLALKIWTLCYAVELSCVNNPGAGQWWSALKFIGIVLLPPGLWMYVYEYTGRGKLPNRWLALMAIEPIAVLALLAIPQTSHLIHDYGNAKVINGISLPASTDLFWAHAIYTYALMLGAVSLLLSKLARIAPAYRRQGAVLMGASLLPFITNVIWNIRFGDDVFDPTPLVFGVTAVTMVWGFFRLKLLDVTPVARGIVIEQMTDGVLVLDVYGRVADANAAAGRMVGLLPTAMIGRDASAFLPDLRPILEVPSPLGPIPLLIEVTLGATDATPPDPMAAASPAPAPVGKRDVAVSLSPVTDQGGREVARSLVLRDVTERNRTERQLRQLLEEQTRVSETLRQTLRPSQLPAVDGLRLAARSVPSARGGGVGGDFYDVHQIPGGRSAFVLGDVSGKGVHAAVVTSLARYTVRALSAQGLSPRQVLEHTNHALNDQDDDERFCTVVYGHVLPHSPGLDGVRLLLTLGGHPLPLIRRREGTVHAVGTPGTALGLLPRIDVTEVVVDLAAGDVLLAYTDGVTEARNGGEQFGEERLASVLAGIDVRALAERHQQSIASAHGSLHGSSMASMGLPRPGEPPPMESTPPEGGSVVAASRNGPGRPGSAPVGLGDPAQRPHLAGLLADAVADTVLHAVGSFSPERDDVALLVLAAT